MKYIQTTKWFVLGESEFRIGELPLLAMMSDTGMRPVAMSRPRGGTAGAIVRAQPVTETSLMESGMSKL